MDFRIISHHNSVSQRCKAENLEVGVAHPKAAIIAGAWESLQCLRPRFQI